MLISFRTDASSDIGLGHLRRCISLGRAMRALGARCLFVLRDSDVNGLALVRGEGFEGTLLSSPASEGMVDQVVDAEAFVNSCTQLGPDWVIVDHYRLSSIWHKAVRASLGCRVAAIDDLADRALDVDALIDHNYVEPPGHREKYRGLIRERAVKWLCGPRFALLGPGYKGRPIFQIAERVRSIGIFLGGTDPAGLSLAALEACRKVAGFDGPIEIVSTTSNPNLAVLRQAIVDSPGVSLSVDLPDLAGFYARHDLHVGAGGGSTWERCAVGAPTLTLCVADNQLSVIPALQALGALATCADNSVEAIGTAVGELIKLSQMRTALSRSSQILVDGLGAERVAMALLAEVKSGLTLRSVVPADAATLWQWRNHPATRGVSRNQAEIPLDAHCRWVEKTLANPQILLLIGQIAGRDFGVIRFDRRAQGNIYEVSLYLDPTLHGLGLGAALLRAGEAALLSTFGAAVIHAEVLAANFASRRLFVACGYEADSPTTYFKSAVTNCTVPGQQAAVHDIDHPATP